MNRAFIIKYEGRSMKQVPKYKRKKVLLLQVFVLYTSYFKMNKVNLKDILGMAIQALRTHRGRSLLTVLGIVIGIASIMIVMSVGSSATELIVGEVQSFGPENVFINPGKPSEGGLLNGGGSTLLLKSLTEKDVEDLKKKENIPNAVFVNPSVNASVNMSYLSETKTAAIVGSGAESFSVYNLSPKEGRFFTEEEVQDKAAVAVIGKNVAEDLFGNQSPIGEKVKMKNKMVRVIGVFSSLNASMFGIDDLVIMPYTTVQQDLMGIRHFHEIAVKADNAKNVPGMVEDIKTLLRNNHDIEDPTDDDFIVTTQEDMIKIVGDILGAVTVFLSFVAAISLVVGGIGVMNIMFVSVTERTKEIGLRKALGATNKNVMLQFLMEAILLTSFGGILGVVFGTLFTLLVTFIASTFTGLNFPFFFSVKGSLMGLAVACGTGIIFGLFPARAAAKKSPMEALHYE